jgi:NADH-quinone oxidoreductase subunit N
MNPAEVTPNMTQWMTMQDLVIVLPMIVLFCVSIIPLLIKAILGNREPKAIATLSYSFIGLVLALGVTASLGGAKITGFSGAIVMDGVSVWMSSLVYIITGASLMLAYDHMATKGNQFTEFAFLTTSSAIGMVTLIMSNDLIVTFIGIEMMSLCLYILVAMSKEQILSKEAAFKYFVLGSFASAIFLYGIALVYGTAGSTYFPDIATQTTKLIGTNRVFLAGLGLVILGFLFKVSIFPFHAWVPDVYQGAPTPITAFMATAVKAATFASFLRLFNSESLGEAHHLMTLLSWLAVFTMVFGNAAAILQDNFKRVLAYSGIAHSGYILIGLIAAGFGSDYNNAAPAVLFYLLSYAIMTFGAFALIAVLEKNENTSLSVNDLKGLGRRYPLLALSLTALMLSLAGLPPTLGFFGKFYIFSAAIEQDMYWLPFWGVLSSVISVYYYLRPIVVMYMHDGEAEEITARYMSRASIGVCAILIIVMGIFASPLFKAMRTQFPIAAPAAASNP